MKNLLLAYEPEKFKIEDLPNKCKKRTKIIMVLMIILLALALFEFNIRFIAPIILMIMSLYAYYNKAYRSFYSLVLFIILFQILGSIVTIKNIVTKSSKGHEFKPEIWGQWESIEGMLTYFIVTLCFWIIILLYSLKGIKIIYKHLGIKFIFLKFIFGLNK